MRALDFASAIALLAACAAGLAAYAWQLRGQSSPTFDRVRSQGGTIFLGETLMNAGYWLLQPCVQACVRRGISPARLSWLSLAPAIGAALAAAHNLWGLAAWGLLLSALLDVLDGAVARATDRASAAGAVLDSVLDRYAELVFFAGLLAHFRFQIGAQLLCFAAAAGSVLVTYSTAKAEALHVTPPRGWMKRSDRLACLVVGALASAFVVRDRLALFESPWRPVPIVVALALIAILANVSAIIRFRALSREVKS